MDAKRIEELRVKHSRLKHEFGMVGDLAEVVNAIPELLDALEASQQEVENLKKPQDCMICDKPGAVIPTCCICGTSTLYIKLEAHDGPPG